MFYESAAYVVDAMHAIGPFARVPDVARACRLKTRTVARYINEMEDMGLVWHSRSREGGHRRWSLTARGEAFRQALMVQPEPLAEGNAIEVAIVSDGTPDGVVDTRGSNTLHVNT